MSKKILKEDEILQIPRKIILKSQGVLPLSVDEQRNFLSGAGMLLYFLKFSQPDIVISVREISKRMESATKGCLK